jgi:drug/metabolite transporter (DMT)-like permease
MGPSRAGVGPDAGPGTAENRALPREGLLLLAAITLFWGVNWPTMKLALSEVPVLTFRTICLLAGGLGVLAICRVGRLPLRIPRGQLRPVVLVTVFNITGWHLLSASALLYMEAGRASIVAFTMPLWATLLAVPVLGERLRGTTIIGLVVGLAGIGVLVLPSWRTLVTQPLGLLFMLAAALSWAAGTVGLKYYRWRMPTAVLTGWQLLLGSLPIAAGALVFDADFTPAAVSTTAWLATLYAALIPIIFCQWAWFRVVALFPAAIAAIGTLAIPVIGVLSSAIGLGEPIGLDVILSLILVCLALGIVLILPTLRRSGH